MKEFIIAFTADFTFIDYGEELNEETANEKWVRDWLKDTLSDCQDVQVKNFKVFEREVEE